MKNNVIFIAFTCLIFILLPLICYAPPEHKIPIDGGITWLLAAGGIYGFYKITGKKAKKEE